MNRLSFDQSDGLAPRCQKMNHSFLFTVRNSLLSGNLLRSLSAMALLLGVGWSAAETSENGFVPPPIPSLARWEEQIVQFGEQHLAATDKAIADPKPTR